MNWDIDKGLTSLEASIIPGTIIQRVAMDLSSMEREKIKPTADEIAKGGCVAWCLALGKISQRKVFFYGRTIHTAYIKARKEVKNAKDLESLAFFGLKKPKRSNSFMKARALKKKAGNGKQRKIQPSSNS